MKPTVLVVDDDPDVRALLAEMLRTNGYRVKQAENREAVVKAFEELSPSPDLILLDLILPDADGFDLISDIKREWADTEVIVLTGHATFEKAVEATKRGAYNFLNKPVDYNTLVVTAERALEHKQLNETAQGLRKALSSLSGQSAPVIKSAAMKAIVQTIQRVAASDVPILLTGESGTGKEVIADLTHALSHRYEGPIIKVNCAALPRELIESELFGAVKGAYTGALSDRDGLFRQAHGGTLVLDELPEMPIETQSKLLRVLHNKEYRPVGGKKTLQTDCRIVASTNRKIDQAIAEGFLREDLYYRISAITLELPPLRERPEEIVPLANNFLRQYTAQSGRRVQRFSKAALDALRQFNWPGNVRQLQNEVQRAVLLCQDQEVQASDLSFTRKHPRETDDRTDKRPLIESVERNTIVQVLQETDGNKVEAAKRLGIGRQTLYNKIKNYRITLERPNE